MTEVHHLLLDTKTITNMKKDTTGKHIEYEVQLSGNGGFDYGDIKWITKVQLKWLKLETWSQNFNTIPYISVYIDEIGDQIISNNEFHNRSSFIIPIENGKNLTYMNDAMANTIHFIEPIQSLSKFTVVMKADDSLVNASNEHVHTMLLTFHTERRQLY